jgi:hypothetical protein
MRLSLLLCGCLCLAGCGPVSLEDVIDALPTDDNPSTNEPGDGDSVVLCVTNRAEVAITYQVGEVNAIPTAAALEPGTGECFSAPCDANVGVDQIFSETFSNPAGAQFLGSQIPCGSVFEIRIEPDGSVLGFVDTESLP